MSECIFCQIIRGDVPSYKLYEDEMVIAILDHRPVRNGATMIIPKIHSDHFIDLSDELAAHIVKIGNMIGRKMQLSISPKRVGFAVSGFGVAHVHYHVIPMDHETDVTSGVYARCQDGQIVFDMSNTPLAPADIQEKMVDLLSI